MFLEFARNLVESVKSGTPISRSILNIRKKVKVIIMRKRILRLILEDLKEAQNKNCCCRCVNQQE